MFWHNNEVGRSACNLSVGVTEGDTLVAVAGASDTRPNVTGQERDRGPRARIRDTVLHSFPSETRRLSTSEHFLWLDIHSAACPLSLGLCWFLLPSNGQVRCCFFTPCQLKQFLHWQTFSHTVGKIFKESTCALCFFDNAFGTSVVICGIEQLKNFWRQFIIYIKMCLHCVVISLVDFLDLYSLLGAYFLYFAFSVLGASFCVHAVLRRL